MTCGHWDDGTGYCGADAPHTYLTGWRCPEHTPARLAGRPEQSGGDQRKERTPPAPMSASTLMDDRAVRSGKRRSSPARYQEAKGRVDKKGGAES